MYWLARNKKKFCVLGLSKKTEILNDKTIYESLKASQNKLLLGFLV
jgi:hypothetical protein